MLKGDSEPDLESKFSPILDYSVVNFIVDTNRWLPGYAYGVKNFALFVPFGLWRGIAGTAFFNLSTWRASWISKAIEFSISSTSLPLSVSIIKLYLNLYKFFLRVSYLTILLTASSDSSSLGSICFLFSKPISNRLSIRFLGWKPSRSFTNFVLPVM